MRYFVGTELGIANTIQRHFDWPSNSLWFEEIPNARDPKKTLVVLGGKDAILNAEVSRPSQRGRTSSQSSHSASDGILAVTAFGKGSASIRMVAMGSHLLLEDLCIRRL